VPGQDLGRLLVERGALTVAQAAAIGAEVAAALAAAHRIGLAHGSLDAADVIVGDQRVTVVGFGAAWMREAAGGGRPDAPGTVESPGTLGGLRAPGGPDPQDDLGALGAMLCQMVTGAPSERWPAASPIDGAGLPLPLRQIVARLTASDPDDRYRAAEAVRADLLHLAHGQASPASPADTPPSWVSAAQAGPGGTPGGAAAQAGPGGTPGGAAAQAEPQGRGSHGAGRGGGEAWGRYQGTRRRLRRRGTWMAVIVGLALLGGAVAGVLALARDPGERATIPTPRVPTPSGATTVQAAGVPDVVGLDEQAATGMLGRDGFVANISRQPSEEPPGVVTSQSPGAGQHPPPGAIVLLTVSTGPADSTNPSPGPGPNDPGDTTDPPTTESAARTPRAPTTATQASP
jgi:serine/threonine-protein kinase